LANKQSACLVISTLEMLRLVECQAAMSDDRCIPLENTGHPQFSLRVINTLSKIA
jgi:hypothetical protein